jgi:excisionase family DNA binding protein
MSVLTVKEVAEQLKVSPGCVYQLVAERKLGHVRVGCGRGAIRVPESDLQVFLTQSKVEPKATTLVVTGLRHIKLAESPARSPA